MRNPKFMIGLLAALVLVFITSILIPQAVQAQQCLNSDNRPVPCPNQKRKSTKTPIPTRKPTATLTLEPAETPTPVVDVIPPPPNDPPVLPGQGSSPFNFPGPLGMLIIVVCIIGGIGAFMYFRKPGGSKSFEIEDFHFSEENPTTIGSATGGAGGGKAEFAEFNITKETDKATPLMTKYKTVNLSERDVEQSHTPKIDEAEERGAGGGGDGSGINTDNGRHL